MPLTRKIVAMRVRPSAGTAERLSMVVFRFEFI
jgi:hypothetical protein